MSRLSTILAAADQFKEALRNTDTDQFRAEEVCHGFDRLLRFYDSLHKEGVNKRTQPSITSFLRKPAPSPPNAAPSASDDTPPKSPQETEELDFEGFMAEIEGVQVEVEPFDSEEEEEEEENVSVPGPQRHRR